MSQHLWLWTGGGGRCDPCCRHAPEWDHSKTTEYVGRTTQNVGVWQGPGDKCKTCLKRAFVLARELHRNLGKGGDDE